MATTNISIRTPHEGEWLRIRSGAANYMVAPLMCSNGSNWCLVADHIVEQLRRDHGIEPPCERNGIRYVWATIFQAAGRNDPGDAASEQFFLWPIEQTDDDMMALARTAMGEWTRYGAASIDSKGQP